jgi:hypothetical protein
MWGNNHDSIMPDVAGAHLAGRYRLSSVVTAALHFPATEDKMSLFVIPPP